MSYREADDRLVRVVRAVAVQAALLSAAVHLLWAVDRIGDAADVRPYLFVLSGGLLVLVAAAVFRGAHYRRLYALGAGILAAQFVAYVLWHGPGDAIPALASDPFALVARIAELIGIVTFAALFSLAPPTRVAAERRAGAFEESLLSDIVDEDDVAEDETNRREDETTFADDEPDETATIDER